MGSYGSVSTLDVLPNYVVSTPDVLPNYVVSTHGVIPNYVVSTTDVLPNYLYVLSTLDVRPNYDVSLPVVDILNDEQRETFLIINMVSFCSIISFFGIIGNIINIVIFLKQGFANTVNISFFGLAISDMCCLLTLLWMSLCFSPLVSISGIPWVARDVMYLPGGWPHVTFGRITSFITVYVTAERCLCIIAPLKIKEIVTPLRTTVIVCFIYIVNILTLLPEYATSYLDWKFFPASNITLLALFYTEDRANVVGIVFFLSFVTGVTSFIAVIIFTVILAVKLKQTSELRQEISSSKDHKGSMTNREKKTMKMIVVIATILIVCYTPGAAVSMTSFVVPEFDLEKGYANIEMAMWSVASLFSAISSSVNIILYCKMSSKYKETFGRLFVSCVWSHIDMPKRKNTKKE